MEPMDHWPLVVADANRKFPSDEFKVTDKAEHDGRVLQIFPLGETRPLVTLVFSPIASIINGEGRIRGKTIPKQFKIIDRIIEPDIYAFFDDVVTGNPPRKRHAP